MKSIVYRLLFMICFGSGLYSATNGEVSGGIALCLLSLLIPLLDVLSTKQHKE